MVKLLLAIHIALDPVVLLMEKLGMNAMKISTCHFPIGFSPQECVVMKAQFVKPEEEKSCETIS